jgi:hypothetical protein
MSAVTPKVEVNFYLYRARNLVERFFNKIEQPRPPPATSR